MVTVHRSGKRKGFSSPPCPSASEHISLGEAASVCAPEGFWASKRERGVVASSEEEQHPWHWAQLAFSPLLSPQGLTTALEKTFGFSFLLASQASGDRTEHHTKQAAVVGCPGNAVFYN